MSISIRNEHGAAKILMVIGVLILVVAIYAGIQLLPLYWDHGNFEETVKSTMISALVPPYKDVEGTVKQKIITLLDDMGAQYEPEYVKVDVSPDYKKIQVEVWYARAHHLLLYPNPKRFYFKREHTSILPKAIELPQPTPLPEID